MCPKDMDLIQLLVKNKIPIVLHFSQRDEEIFLYVSNQVGINIFNSILQKKHQMSHIICHNSRQRKIKIVDRGFTVITHHCTRYTAYIFIVVLKEGFTPQSLKVFSTKTNSNQYVGIKNKKLKIFTDADLHKIVREYLL